MSLKTKILIGYGVAFALMALVIAWGVVNLVSLGKASDAILRENYRSILAAENMVDAIERQDSGTLLLLLGDTEVGISHFRQSEALFLQWLARAKDNITIPGEAQLVHGIDADYEKYRRQFSAMTSLPGAAEVPSTLNLITYQQSVYPLFAKIRDACVQLRNLNEETMYAASVRAGRVAERAIWSTVLVAASASVLALIFSLLLAERIVKPIRHFMEASSRISSGDYLVEVPVETRDELGRLAVEFNRMATQLGRYHEMNIDQIVSEKNKGEAILASIEDGMVVFDTELRVTGINPAARRILGLELTECLSLHCSDILPVPAVCDLIGRTMESGAPPSIPEEQRIVTLPAGEQVRHYLFSATVIRGRDRLLSGVVLLLRDVTRLKEVEQLKSEFVMAASHELRTPLTSMGMSIDLLLEHTAQGLAEKDRELLQVAHEEVSRLKALVNDLLDLSKIEAGRIELQLDRVPIRELFARVHDVFKGQLAKSQVELSSGIPEDLPSVRADANKITWVLTNLISNALRYVGEGGHIHFNAVRMGNQVHLSVRDDGPGIPLEYQTKIFQKFVQIKGLETGGTGLGLAICREIVRAHGGTIWVESSVGEGSAFTFTLPAV
jgi:NtrC-family two-component system sensor histidine kinase KinB